MLCLLLFQISEVKEKKQIFSEKNYNMMHPIIFKLYCFIFLRIRDSSKFYLY